MKMLTPIVLFLPLWLSIIFPIHFAQANEPVTLVEKKILKSDAHYEWQELRLKTKLTGEFKIWQRGVRAAGNPLPVVFLLAGIESNKAALDMLGKTDAYIITLDYKIPTVGRPEEKAAAVAKRFLQIEAEYISAMIWLMQNSETYDMAHFSSVNISFGSFIAPMALRFATKLGFVPRATVFAFGGAEIKNFVLPFAMLIQDENLRLKAERTISDVFDEIDPARHLRHLRGPFLVIRGAEDEIIPSASSDALERALSADKTILVLPTAHIDTDQPNTIRLTREATMDFLKKKGAL